jgi:hypothetical protein
MRRTEHDGVTETAVRRRGKRAVGTAAVGAALVLLLAGCFSGASHHDASSKKHHSATPVATGTPLPTGTSTDTPGASATTAAPVPSPSQAPDPAASRPATAPPQAAPAPDPVQSPVPAGTVVAAGDVASPKGSIHFHYRVVASGSNTYAIQYSDFTSTLPVPVGAMLKQVAPSVGDGLTFHGVGDRTLGGPTTTPTSGSASLTGVSQPRYLTTVVTYSAASPNASGIPTEISSNKVLAVSRITWSVPVRQTNVHPVDHGPRSLATGSVTAKTAAGAPASYLIASGDETAEVAARFGISVKALIFLNPSLQVFGAQQYLYEGTTLNLDPDRL